MNHPLISPRIECLLHLYFHTLLNYTVHFCETLGAKSSGLILCPGGVDRGGKIQAEKGKLWQAKYLIGAKQLAVFPVFFYICCMSKKFSNINRLQATVCPWKINHTQGGAERFQWELFWYDMLSNSALQRVMDQVNTYVPLWDPGFI